MFEGLATLLVLSTLMAIASFGAGLLPLTLSLSQSRLRLLSTVGMGVLVGTALIVIIPEGVETLYSSTGQVDHVHRRDILHSRALDVRWQQNSKYQPRTDANEAFDALPGPVIPDGISVEAGTQEPPKTPTDPEVISILDTSTTPVVTQPLQREPHAWIGVSLVSGFILMYLIDTLPSVKPPVSPPRGNIYSLSDLSSTAPPSSTRQRSSASFSTTLGLVIHAAADGIALGASSTIPSISFIIFFAIMIHKAPAAFGLTSVLLKQGLGKRQARAHLMAFSLAAPAGALLTWTVVRLLGSSMANTHPESMKFWTGVILIFSGGTFLYVAMHTMQELDSSSMNDDSQSNGYLDSSERYDTTRPRPQKDLQLIGASVVGMLLPLVTQIGHAH